MKRFINLKGQHVGFKFAWWDTIRDEFECFKGWYAFNTWEEFKDVYNGDEIERYKSLCPKWVFKSKKKTIAKHI